MKPALTLVFSMFFAIAAAAQPGISPRLDPHVKFGEEVDLSKFLWKNRLLVIFADSPGDPRFIEQISLLEAGIEELVERDVVLLIDTSPADATALREKFRPRGFMLMLIGKDGNVYLRKPLPWDVREISRSIDKMPLRRQELRN